MHRVFIGFTELLDVRDFSDRNDTTGTVAVLLENDLAKHTSCEDSMSRPTEPRDELDARLSGFLPEIVPDTLIGERVGEAEADLLAKAAIAAAAWECSGGLDARKVSALVMSVLRVGSEAPLKEPTRITLG